MTSRILSTLVVGLVTALSAVMPNAAAPLTLGTSGGQFTVNGEPRFLVLVSYFDALDAAALDEDLALLSRPADGVRVFANWWDVSAGGDCPNRFSDTTLFERTPEGVTRARPGRVARLQHVLRRARRHGLVVDLTFAADPVAGVSRLAPDSQGRVCPSAGFKNDVEWSGIGAAMADVALALEADEFDHVFFDLQNEAGHDWNGAAEADLARLVTAVRAVSPRRLLSVSSFDGNADSQAARVRELGLSMLNFHDVPRGEGWGDRTAEHVRRFRGALRRAGLDVPVYAGEPDHGSHGRGLTEFRAAVAGARDAGAAAWTFHHRDGYRLDDGALDERLDPLTRRVLGALPGWLGR